MGQRLALQRGDGSAAGGAGVFSTRLVLPGVQRQPGDADARVWDALPDELFIHIIGRLSAEDRLRASGVCRRWRLLCLPEAPRLVGVRGGSSGFESIGDAIEEASEGGIVLVAPGRYEEELVLEKEVHVLGSRGVELHSPAKVTVTCTGDCAPSLVGVRIPSATVSGIDIRGRSRVRIERCEVSAAGFGVIVRDEGTAPILRGNELHGCGLAAVGFFDGAGGLLEDNDIFLNQDSGVSIAGRANPTVRRNTFRDQRCGVLVSSKGRGRIVRNVVERTPLPFDVQQGATCALEGNSVKPMPPPG